MKKCFLVLLIFFISACNLPGGSGATQTASPGKSTSPCGDGVCSGPENANNCQPNLLFYTSFSSG